MNWLVTGGCGFVGANLVKAILEDSDDRVRVVDDLSVGREENLGDAAPVSRPSLHALIEWPGRLELVVGDVRDAELAGAAAQGVDAIVHLAGNTGVQPSIRDPRGDCVANVIGTLNYLEAARLNDVKRFVFASSGGTVIGDVVPPIHEEMVAHPKSPYGASKSACEGYCSAYAGTYGIGTVALRFSNVYGPGSTHKGSVVAAFIRNALAGKPWTINGDGDQTRDFLYVKDLVEGIRAAAAADGLEGEAINIASGNETSVNELTSALAATLEEYGLSAPSVTHGPSLPGEIRRNYSVTEKARRLLDWEARTPLSDGLRATVAWFAQQGPVPS